MRVPNVDRCSRLRDFGGYKRALIVFAALLFCLRVFNIDCDVPSTGIGMALGIDEGNYSCQAINLVKNGSWRVVDGVEIDCGDNYKAQVLSFLLQACTMRIFGLTYLGLRLPSTIAGLAAYLLYLYIVQSNLEHSKNISRGQCALLLALEVCPLLCFPLFLASRMAEPSVFRLMINMVFITAFITSRGKPRLQPFLMGLIAVGSIFFIYFSHLTLIAVLFVYCGIMLIRGPRKQALSYVIWAMLGALVAYIAAEQYYQWAWSDQPLHTFMNAIRPFSNRVTSKSSANELGMMAPVLGFLKFWASNIFYYDASLIPAALLGVAVSLYEGIRQKDDFMTVCALIPVMMVLQSTFTNDWIQRKSISVYLPILLCIWLAVSHNESLRGEYRTHLSGNRTVLLPISIIIPSMLLAGFAIQFRLEPGAYSGYGEGNFFSDFGVRGMHLSLFAVVAECILSCSLIMCCAAHLRLTKDEVSLNLSSIVKCERVKYILLAIGVIFSINNCAFCFRYGYVNRDHTERAAMEQIGELATSAYVGDPLVYGFSLYNDIKPLTKKGDGNTDLFTTNRVEYAIDYAKQPYVLYEYTSKDNVVLVGEFDRSATAWGRQKNIGLYRIIKQEGV